MSISKPSTYALAVEQRGVAFMAERVGVDATGFPYNSLAAYSPRLDAAGNSVRAALAIRTLADRWALHGVDRLLGGAGP